MQQPLPQATSTQTTPTKPKVSNFCPSVSLYPSSISEQNNTDSPSLEGDTNDIAGGQAPQDAASGTSQSGTEPVSGKLGEGEAGQPYDAGNEDGMCTSLRARQVC